MKETPKSNSEVVKPKIVIPLGIKGTDKQCDEDYQFELNHESLVKAALNNERLIKQLISRVEDLEKENRSFKGNCDKITKENYAMQDKLINLRKESATTQRVEIF